MKGVVLRLDAGELSSERCDLGAQTFVVCTQLIPQLPFRAAEIDEHPGDPAEAERGAGEVFEHLHEIVHTLHSPQILCVCRSGRRWCPGHDPTSFHKAGTAGGVQSTCVVCACNTS